MAAGRSSASPRSARGHLRARSGRRGARLGPVASGELTTTFTIGDRPVHRLGYGTMQLTGPGVWGPPGDPAGAVAVLRRAAELGVELFDTADSYGPYVAEELLREALHPYDGLTIATKAGFLRTGPSQWVACGRPEYLRQQCEMSPAPPRRRADRPLPAAPGRRRRSRRRAVRPPRRAAGRGQGRRRRAVRGRRSTRSSGRGRSSTSRPCRTATTSSTGPATTCCATAPSRASASSPGSRSRPGGSPSRVGRWRRRPSGSGSPRPPSRWRGCCSGRR